MDDSSTVISCDVIRTSHVERFFVYFDKRHQLLVFNVLERPTIHLVDHFVVVS